MPSRKADKMPQQIRWQLWVAAVAGVIFFAGLSSTALFDMDEALYATTAREMLDRGDWVVPWFNGAMFPEKPPLMFWNMMAGFELFGRNGELGARFFSALLGVGTVLAAFHLGRILFNPRVGLWTGLITASTIIFTVSARAATVDSALTFLTTLAFLFFAMGWKDSRLAGGLARRVPGQVETWQASLPAKRGGRFPLRCAVPMYACIGLTALGKGPVGVVLPLAAMGLFLLVSNGWRNVFRSAWAMRPFTALLVIAVVAAPWYIEVGRRTDWVWPTRFFLEFNLRPFQQPILGHGDTSSFDRFLAALVSFLYFFYQIPAVLVGFFPWSVFAAPTAVDVVRRLRTGKTQEEQDNDASHWRVGTILALCWFGTWFVFWSICKTKLPHYLLPAYPALALLTACFVERWLATPAAVRPWMLRYAWVSTILAGVGVLIAVPIVAAIYLPGQWTIALVGLIPIVGGAWCWRCTSRGRHEAAAVGFAVTSVAFLVAVFVPAAERVDRFQNARSMMAAIRADEGDANENRFGVASPVAAYRFFRESTVFYAGHPVTRCVEDPSAGRSARKELKKFIARHDRSYVVTTDEDAREIAKYFPGVFQEIHREPRFLAHGEMVVLRVGGRKDEE